MNRPDELSDKYNLDFENDLYIEDLEEYCNSLEAIIDKSKKDKLLNSIKMVLTGFKVFGATNSTIVLENGDTLKLELIKKEKENGETNS